MKKLLLFICSIFFTINLSSQVSIISQTNASCSGMCNGAITLSITGGTMPYTVSNLGSSSCTFPPYPPVSSNTITITGLCACAYSIQVKDGTNTLIGTAPATITAPPPIVVSFSVQNICCNGQCNGNIFPFVSGGIPPYSYTWSPFSPPNLCAGNYTLSVIDSKGCLKASTTQVTQPAPFSLGTGPITPASCSTCCNGQVNVTAIGGSPGYSYTLYTAPPVTNTTGTFSNVCAGSYSVCASDAGCCSICIGVTVPYLPSAIANLAPQSVNISVVPNPSDGNFKISAQQNISQFNYEIFDIIGNKIVSGKAADNININQSADGVYILLLRNVEGEIVARRKINVKH